MADIKSPEARSLNMSHIRSRDTSPEVWLRKQLFAEGYRYRKNVNNVPGHPDLWLPKYQTALFVHGCFWHRHPDCRYAYTPKSRVDFWQTKFQKNVQRDQAVREELQKAGLRRLVVWECTVNRMRKSPEEKARVTEEIRNFLESDRTELEL